MLFLSWTLLYLDRSITGPVVTWMISGDVAFMVGAPFPHALGGIIGSMFFAGYMLTQFPAGYLGDRFGHRAVIVLSLLWSAMATMASGLVRDLVAFVGTRVLTGLGEGAYYSNDRAVVCESTPRERRSLGMGVVFSGLALGMTLAFVLTPPILEAGAAWLGKEGAWSLPFLLFSAPTLLLGAWLWRAFKVRTRDVLQVGKRMVPWSVVFLATLMAVYVVTIHFGLGQVVQAAFVLLAASALVLVIHRRLGGRGSAVMRDRNLLFLYLSAIPILYTLWFFGFWALMVVSEASALGLSGAAVYAALFGLANGIGYPIGGRLGDRVGAPGRPRLYVALCLGVASAILVMALLIGSDPEPFLLGGALFVTGVLFAASQTVHMTMAGDLAPPGERGQAFGMWNLVAEVGAVIAPVLSGALRDLTGDWGPAIILDGLLLIASAIIVALFVRAGREGADWGS
jgi:MFS family permease